MKNIFLFPVFFRPSSEIGGGNYIPETPMFTGVQKGKPGNYLKFEAKDRVPGVKEALADLKALIPRVSVETMNNIGKTLKEQINDSKYTISIDPINPNRFLVKGLGIPVVYLQPSFSGSGIIEDFPFIDVHSINGDKYIAVLEDKTDVNTFFSQLLFKTTENTQAGSLRRK